MARSKRWEDLTPREKLLIAVLSTVQISVAVCAWVDLARRPAAQVNGPKRR